MVCVAAMLPATLMALMSASPVFSMLQNPYPTSPNDLFHAISLQVPKRPEEPLCCLRPQPPSEPAEDADALLMSFEDWKARKLQDKEVPSNANAHGPPAGSESASEAGAAAEDASSSSPPLQDVAEQGSTLNEHLPPHFRVPIIDRFNYASMDCSARVHTSHRSAKSPFAILSSKKDRYMLSPCDEQRQFVVVELCDDIRIDTVQLANFEFFSGVFRDFTVSVAKTYTTDASEGWTYAGTFRARNVRAVQSFHPPTSLSDFYRYIRIDFHSHYGNEYYCPVSLLRVYGLTHLEEWKWDVWESEAQAKRTPSGETVLPSFAEEAPPPVGAPKVETGSGSTSAIDAMPVSSSQTGSDRVEPGQVVKTTSTSDSSASVTKDERDGTGFQSSSLQTLNDSAQTTLASSDSRHSVITTSRSDHDRLTTIDDILPKPLSTLLEMSSSLSSGSSSAAPSSSSSSADGSQVSSPDASVSPASSSSSTYTYVTTVSTTPSMASVAIPSVAATTGGESIYRTIMNRLTALEGNMTLYARYVEEQTAGVREVLRRLGEDVGRLEGIGKAQAQTYQRSIQEFDRHRRRLELEYGELLARVNFLADEVQLEKRLGIAQLCLLICVIVFMAFTRGSRGEPPLLEYGRSPSGSRFGRTSSMGEWGRRTLSLSGDWMNRLRTGSPAPAVKTNKADHINEKFSFPSQTVTLTPDTGNVRKRPATSAGRRGSSPSRPRTPVSHRVPATAGRHHRPTTPTGFGARPVLQRSNSHGQATLQAPGLVGPVPRSAKRWARSAHLHEVKGGAGPRVPKEDVENIDISGGGKGKGRDRNEEVGRSHRYKVEVDNGLLDVTNPDRERRDRQSSPLRVSISENTETETEANAWIDTDMDADDSEVDVAVEEIKRSR